MRERSSPDAGVRVKPIMTLSALNIDASKYGKEQISCTVQEMFEEAGFRLNALNRHIAKVQSAVTGNHSILALSNVRQFAAARSCIRRRGGVFSTPRRKFFV